MSNALPEPDRSHPTRTATPLLFPIRRIPFFSGLLSLVPCALAFPCSGVHSHQTLGALQSRSFRPPNRLCSVSQLARRTGRNSIFRLTPKLHESLSVFFIEPQTSELPYARVPLPSSLYGSTRAHPKTRMSAPWRHPPSPTQLLAVTLFPSLRTPLLPLMPPMTVSPVTWLIQVIHGSQACALSALDSPIGPWPTPSMTI